MTESGGQTTQSGILYQNSIAALFLGRLLDDTPRPMDQRVDRVRVETLDDVDDIVITFADNHKTYIQAKEDVSIYGDVWKKLWENFGKQFLNKQFDQGKDKISLWLGKSRNDYFYLDELCNRATTSKNFEEWEQRIKINQKTLLEKIKPHLPIELLENEILLKFFAHIEVEIHSLKSIERDEMKSWIPESSIYQIALFRLLRDHVGGASRIRAEFTAYPLRTSLLNENPGLVFLKSQEINNLQDMVFASSSMLRYHKSTIGNTDIHIRRNVVDEIINWVIDSNDDTDNLAMLIDQAGTGKTIVLHDVQLTLEKQGYTVLAIKADQQLSGITQLEDIKTSLGFTFSPEQILNQLSRLGRVVVLIDQIDTLSLSLAHDQRTLDIVLDFVARIRRIPNLRILISCRLFDRNSDYRIKQINSAQSFSLLPLNETEISNVLKTIGGDFQTLQTPVRNLLQTPLHLNLFVLALENNHANQDIFGVTSLQELYGAVWREIILKDDRNAPSKADRVQVVWALKDYMAKNQVTSVPQNFLLQFKMDSPEHVIKWLASTGMIIAIRDQWTFIHQTFFDYCFARHFVERGQNFVDVIVKSDQGLFIRPLLVQVLSYMRGVNHTQYIKDLNNLLSSTEIRFHLQDLLFRWFGALPNPMDSEWTIAQRMLIDKKTKTRAFQSMFGNPDWFTYLKNNFIPAWLSQDEPIINLTINYLGSIAEMQTTQLAVVNLLKPYIGKNEEWNKRLLSFVFQVRNWHSSETVEFYEQTIKQIPSISRLDVYQIGLLAKTFPQSGIRMLRFILDLVLQEYDKKKQDWLNSEGDTSRFLAPTIYEELNNIENHDLEEAFDLVSKADPKFFLEKMIPWFENVLARQDIPKDPSPFYFVWDHLSGNWYNHQRGVEKAFIFGFVGALASTAKNDPNYFEDEVDRLEQSPFLSPQKILVHVFRALSETHASKALAFILADRRRLEIGDVDDYDSRLLIREIYPYLSEEERSILEDFILQPPRIRKDRGVNGLRWRGIEQLHLLQSIPKEYLSERALVQLAQWEHKFPNSKPVDNPITLEGGVVSSPIPTKTAQKMTDSQWINAINKYDGTYEHREFLKGGAEQLSGVLQSLIKEDPKRYFSLLKKIDNQVDDAYVQAFISGFSESSAPIGWLIDTIRRFSEHEHRKIKRTIAWAIEKRTEERLPLDIIQLLLKYFKASPGEDEWWWAQGENHGDVYSSFLNSDRGASFSALMRIYDAQKNDQTLTNKWELIKYIETDSSTALRLGAIHELTYMIRYDPSRAINSFETLIKGHDILLESRFISEFIYGAFYKNFMRLYPYVQKMMNHENPEVQEQGAQLACIAGIFDSAMESEEAFKTAKALAEQTTSPTASIDWKRGAARIYSKNIIGIPQDICIRKVIELLHEEDEKIHDEIGRVFYTIKAEQFLSLREFVESYAQFSKSFNHKFVECLLNFGLLEPGWGLSLAEILLNSEAFSERFRWRSGYEELIRLVLKIYTNPIADDDLRLKSMDLFDILMEKNPGLSQQILTEWDQR